MHFLKSLLVAGFLLSASLAAPLRPVEVYDLIAREIEPDYAARGWPTEEYIATRDFSEDLSEQLIARDEEYIIDFLVARNKLLKVAKQIKNGLKTKPGEAVFWSGNTPRPGKKPLSAGKEAKKFAKDNGKLTLQMKMKEDKIKIPPYNPKDPKDRSGQLWRMASKRFASKASGTINAFLGQNVNKNSIYKKDEKPILLKKPAVTKLIEHTNGQRPQIAKGDSKPKSKPKSKK
jgi:hypothetical protein